MKTLDKLQKTSSKSVHPRLTNIAKHINNFRTYYWTFRLSDVTFYYGTRKYVVVVKPLRELWLNLTCIREIARDRGSGLD